MIVNRVRGDVFASPHRRIAFAVNTDGYNDAGFAGQVAERFWPGLENTGGNELGEVLVHESSGRVFYALVCHHRSKGGWDDTPRIVRECLDRLEVPESEEIAVVLMGSGLVGIHLGADVDAILAALENSTRKLIVYTL